MTIELRKPQLFNVREDSGDDNDNHANYFTYRAFSFDDVVQQFQADTCHSRHTQSDVVCNDSMSYGDGESFNVWHDQTFTCDTCRGIGYTCKNYETHDAYENEDYPYVECPICNECRSCEGCGSNSIPLHDTITLERVHTDESDTYGTIIDLIPESMEELTQFAVDVLGWPAELLDIYK